VRYDPTDLPPDALAFLAEHVLASLTTPSANGAPHVVPVGFTYDATEGVARVITSGTSQKVRNIERASADSLPVVALCQVDGGRWLTLTGTATIARDPDRIATAVARYAERYRTPGENPARVAIEVAVTCVMGRA
jgi:PPOX class probable F420-dependent enzyme